MLILSFVPVSLGLGFLQILLGAWIVTVGFTAEQAGLLIAAQGIAVVLTSIPLGIVSDIYGRKQLLILGNLAGAAALLVFALSFIMINVTTGIGLVLPGAFPALQSLTGLTNYTLHRQTLLILGLASF